MPFDIGWEEMVLIFFVILIVFGPDKLPEFARMVGRAVREIRKLSAEVTAPLNDLINEPLELETQTVAPATPGPPENICPNCGARNISEKTECGLCGTRLNPPALAGSLSAESMVGAAAPVPAYSATMAPEEPLAPVPPAPERPPASWSLDKHDPSANDSLTAADPSLGASTATEPTPAASVEAEPTLVASAVTEPPPAAAGLSTLATTPAAVDVGAIEPALPGIVAPAAQPPEASPAPTAPRRRRTTSTKPHTRKPPPRA
jgi:Tat protein translocase TatB subunit